ncbi:MAG: GNAT family N-acetyltransferase [Microbacterium gubbeenense]|uniref:GNAT family N-acetyltransferase n=1 Tax=Microbacterium gubbeenense TaxID=159896 RepID=UPI003F96703C
MFATSTPLTVIIPAWVAKAFRRIPIVFEVRDLWPELPIAVGALRNPVMKWGAGVLERVAYRSSTQIVALSPGMKEGVVRAGIDERDVTVITNSSDLDLFDVAGNEPNPWPAERQLVVYSRSPDASLHLYVNSNRQGQGSGRSASDKLVVRAESLGIRRLHLEVNKLNARAIKLCEGAGFEFDLGATVSDQKLAYVKSLSDGIA